MRARHSWIGNEVTITQCNKDEIRHDKEQPKKKQEGKRKRAQVDALKMAGQQFVAQYEKKEKVVAAANAEEYPCHRDMHTANSLTTYQNSDACKTKGSSR